MTSEARLILLALAGLNVFTVAGLSWVAGMTHDILQTDIELAKGLIGANRPDDEVAVALTRRGIDLAAATRLVDDLRNGRPVQAQMPAPEWLSLRRSGRRRSVPTGQDQPTSPEGSQSGATSDRRSSRRTKEEPKGGAAVWLAAAIVVCLLAGGGAVIFNHWQRAKSSTETARAESRPTPTTSSKPQSPQASPVVLEIRTDGLYFGGALLTREEAWNSVAKLLGSPTRTNLVAGSNRMIYAYDHHGILVYAEKGEGTDSIVLDFEGLGGTNGAASPFQGMLRIDDQSIKGDTDSRALTAIKQLGLKAPGSADVGIFGGQYHGLELIFAYLKTPQRLSLVEISLK